MTTFYICRHGKTLFNQQNRLQGQIDSPLTEEGFQNAHVIGRKIKNILFDEVYTSDLGRAFITAYIISRDINYHREINQAKELREINFGDLAGLLLQEAEAKYPQLQEDIYFVPPNGESLKQLQERVLQFVTKLAGINQDKIMLLVTHDSVINALYTAFHKVDFGLYNKEHYNSHDFVGKLNVDHGTILTFEEIK